MTLYERDGEDINQGLIGFWKLDDLKAGSGITKAIDRAKFNDGVITNAANAAGINGLNPHAMLFNGTTTKIDTGTDMIGTGDLTVTAWIKPAGWGEGTSTGRIMENGKVGFYIDDNNNILRFSNDGIATASFSATNSIVLNVWTFVAATRTGTTSTLFINGKLSGARDQNSGTQANGTTNLIIGNRNATDRTFDGIIQNIRVYDKVLSNAVINKLYRLKK